MDETTLITIDALLTAGLIAWAGAWRSLHEKYKDKTDKALTIEPTWHITFSLSAVYFAAFFSLLSIPIAIVSITQNVKDMYYNLAIGFSGFSASILVGMVLTSAAGTWWQAFKGESQWDWLTIKLQKRASLWTIICTATGLVVLLLWIFLIGPAVGHLLAPN